MKNIGNLTVKTKSFDYKTLIIEAYILINKSLEERLYAKQFEAKLNL